MANAVLNVWPDNRSTDQIMIDARGISAETYDVLGGSNGTTVLTGGTIYLTAVYLRVGTLVSNITVAVAQVGVAMTLSKVGLYSTAGVRLALSADQGTAWQSLGNKTIAMITPYVVPVSGAYYTAIVGAGGTLPGISHGNNSAPCTLAAATAIGSGIAAVASQAGQVDLIDPVTVAAGAAPQYIWAAIT